MCRRAWESCSCFTQNRLFGGVTVEDGRRGNPGFPLTQSPHAISFHLNALERLTQGCNNNWLARLGARPKSDPGPYKCQISCHAHTCQLLPQIINSCRPGPFYTAAPGARRRSLVIPQLPSFAWFPTGIFAGNLRHPFRFWPLCSRKMNEFPNREGIKGHGGLNKRLEMVFFIEWLQVWTLFTGCVVWIWSLHQNISF